MREFMSREWVDGDVTIFVREEGQEDAWWTKVGVVPSSERHRSVGNIAECLGLEDMDGTELTRLNDELANPRRW